MFYVQAQHLLVRAAMITLKKKNAKIDQLCGRSSGESGCESEYVFFI